jgi:ABC-type Mn2+/Zn2+ transport system ATPase subunit
LDSYYQPYSASIYNNLNAILRAARQNNTIAAATEFVVVGWQGDGKSALIEAVLGLPLQPGSPTLRPVHYHVHQNSKL